MGLENKDISTCVTCGKQYKVCKKCEKAAGIYVPWRLTACSPTCWQISQIINEWFYKSITAEEAQEMLLNVDFEKIPELNSETQKNIELIMASNKGSVKPAQIKKPIEQTTMRSD
ncbi:MAG: hypothetical protein RR365_00995 [Bacteroides sp.]